MAQDFRKVERLLDTGARIVCLETRHPEQALDLFATLNRYTSKAIYQWQPERGLFRLGMPHISIPGTRGPRGVLEHISQTRHYGAYLLTGFGVHLEDKELLELLKAIAVHPQPRSVVLIDAELPLPDALRPFALRAGSARKRKAS